MLEWRACEIMAELVEGLQSILALGHHRNRAFPAFLTPTLRNIVISLSRLPLVNSYTRVPPLVSVTKTVSLELKIMNLLVYWCYVCVCRSGNWAGPHSQEESLAQPCLRSLWTSCRKRMSSESSSTASTH